MTVSGGTEIDVPDRGVVLFVGPNNAGKSQALKDLLGLARDPSSYHPRTLVGLDLVKEPPADLFQWVTENLPAVAQQGEVVYRVDGWGNVRAQDVVNVLRQPNLSALSSVFILHASGTTRLTAGDSQPSLDFATQFATHPLQRAYGDPDLEKQLDEKSRAAFDLRVTVDRFAGSVITLRMGERPTFEHRDGAPTLEYLNALRALSRLEDQGDGVRSYLGLILFMTAGTHQIMLIDEPEAFLHPPQARLLGRVLAERSSQQLQVFVATHSSNVLQGALETDAPTTVVRLTRVGDTNNAAVLDHEAIKELWSDPLLRYSNVLDGLFHDAVILCECDADCRYYSAVLDASRSSASNDAGVREPQLLFTHAGGKSRMPSVIKALRAVSVPVVVVADFDVLKNKDDVRKILTQLDADPEGWAQDLAIVASALEADTKPLRKTTLRDELINRLDVMEDLIGPKDADTLRAAIRAESGWDKAKRSGKNALTQGQATRACEQLLEKLRVSGLLVVPVGELERFAPSVDGHGPRWVTGVLEQGLHEIPSAEAAAFVDSIRFVARAMYEGSGR